MDDDYKCRCNCGALHQWSAFYVEVGETLWFKSRDHRDKWLNNRGTQYGVDTTPKAPTPAPHAYQYS